MKIYSLVGFSFFLFNARKSLKHILSMCGFQDTRIIWL